MRRAVGAVLLTVALLAAAGLFAVRSGRLQSEWIGRALQLAQDTVSRLSQPRNMQMPHVWADPALGLAHAASIDGIHPFRPAGSQQESDTADYVARVLRGYGYDAVELSFEKATQSGQASSINVVAIARSRWKDAPTILIGAPLSPTSALTGGGSDDASGVAAMLECARVMADKDLSFNVAFVAFGATAQGRAGAKAFCDGAASGQVAPGGLDFAVILDGVGQGQAMGLIPWGGPRACPASVVNGVSSVIRHDTGSRVFLDTTLSFLSVIGADHAPFLVSGTPALTITSSRSMPHFRVGTEGAMSISHDDERPADGHAIARAADAAIAAARYVGGGARRGRLPATVETPYMALSIGGKSLAVPFWVSGVLSVIAVIGACASFAFAGRLVWADGTTYVGESSMSGGIAASVGLYAVSAIVLLTGALPSWTVGLSRGFVRPWAAYPVPHIAAAVATTAFFALLAVVMLGPDPIANEQRVPMVCISLVMQAALVCFSVVALKAGALMPSLSLLITLAALAAPPGRLRSGLAWIAPLPTIWLAWKLVTGIGTVTIGDLLEVPVALCLMAAAALLPYLLSVAALAPGRRSRAAMGKGFTSLPPVSGIGPGAVLREFSGVEPGRGRRTRGTRRSGGHTALVVAGVVALMLWASLFAYPSYTDSRPRTIVAVQGSDAAGNAQVTLVSRENLMDITVTPQAGYGLEGTQNVNVRSVKHRVALHEVAPSVDARVTLEGSKLIVTAASQFDLAWAVAEIRGESRISVESASTGYSVSRARRENVVTAGMNRVNSHTYSAELEIAAPEGSSFDVTVRAGVEDEPQHVMMSGRAARFVLRNEYSGHTQIVVR